MNRTEEFLNKRINLLENSFINSIKTIYAHLIELNDELQELEEVFWENLNELDEEYDDVE